MRGRKEQRGKDVVTGEWHTVSVLYSIGCDRCAAETRPGQVVGWMKRGTMRKDRSGYDEEDLCPACWD